MCFAHCGKPVSSISTANDLAFTQFGLWSILVRLSSVLSVSFYFIRLCDIAYISFSSITCPWWLFDVHYTLHVNKTIRRVCYVNCFYRGFLPFFLPWLSYWLLLSRLSRWLDVYIYILLEESCAQLIVVNGCFSFYGCFR